MRFSFLTLAPACVGRMGLTRCLSFCRVLVERLSCHDICSLSVKLDAYAWKSCSREIGAVLRGSSKQRVAWI